MNFKELLVRAKEKDTYALNQIFLMYKPLLIKRSILEDKRFDEDLYQELCMTLLDCIRTITINDF